MLMLVLGAETGHPFACIGGGRSSGLTFVPFRPPSGLPPRSLPMDPSSLALNFSVTTIMPDWRIGALVRFLANAMRPGKPVSMLLQRAGTRDRRISVCSVLSLFSPEQSV